MSFGVTGKALRGSTCTRCPAAGSLKIALCRAIGIMRLEYKIPDDSSFPVTGKVDCSRIRAWWKEWTSQLFLTQEKDSRRGRRLAMMVKSVNRLFDVPCKSCDEFLKEEAKNDWKTSVGQPTPSECVPTIFELTELRQKIRHLTRGWGRRLAAARMNVGEPALGDYVPGVQGCAERSMGRGGTLSVPREGPFCETNAVRLGCAKTKGKFRVVTMQSAEVKRVLTPLHNALYGHISSKSWCVRGDVLRGDFEEILDDRKKNEFLISGDYTAATNKIYQEAIAVIVDEISKSPYLTEKERKVFVESFTDMRWFSCERSGPMLRGSPMGSLVNFPILCLLNKASFEIAVDHVEGPQRGKVKKVKINGDDIMYAGTVALYQEWRRVTGKYGLEVNESKTEISSRWLDLNSQSFDGKKRKMVAKATLGFLRWGRSEPGTLLRAIIVGMKGFALGHIKKVIAMLRHEVTLRGVLEDLAEVGPYWRAFLIRKKWFRDALQVGKCPVIKAGVKRSLEMCPGPPPKERYYDVVTRLAARAQSNNVEKWIGRPVEPYSEKIDRLAFRQEKRKILEGARFTWKGFQWSFLWPKDIYELFSERYPQVLDNRNLKWRQDHPFLTRKPIGLVERKRMKYPPPDTLLPHWGYIVKSEDMAVL